MTDDVVKDYILLFHGSPHVFEHFAISGVGGGTGDNFYGHGLYFASLSSEGRSYSNQAANVDFTIDGNLIGALNFSEFHYFSGGIGTDICSEHYDLDQKHSWQFSVDSFKEHIEYALKCIDKKLDKNEKNKLDPKKQDRLLSSEDIEKLNVSKKKLLELKHLNIDSNKVIKACKNRFLYTVKAYVREKDLFDWEKQVPENIKLNVEKILNKHNRTLGDKFLNHSVIGSDFYSFLSEIEGGPKQASDLLLSANVLGLKYQSKESNNTNYVIFDDSLIEIQDRVAFKKITKESELPDRTETKNYCRKVIENIHSESNNDVQIVFVDKAADLPQHIQQQCGFDVNVSGVNAGSKCYFVLDNICNRDDAVNIWLHEVGQHNGIKNIIPDKAVREELFCKVWESANELAQNPKNAEIRRAVATARNNYDEAQFSKSELGSEFLAHFSESAFIRNRLNDTEKSFFQSIGRAIRQIIDKCFHIDSKPYMSTKDLTRLTVTSIRSNFRQDSRQQQDLKLQNLFKMNTERKHSMNILTHKKLSVA